MGVQREGVGALHPRVARRLLRREDPERAVRAIDVQPQALALADIGDLGERIDGARAGGARARRDAERQIAGPPVGGDRFGERADVHPECIVDADRADR